ncbi:MAG: OmpA family protein [Candidatus Zhuqueibacterota bacterium]
MRRLYNKHLTLYCTILYAALIPNLLAQDLSDRYGIGLMAGPVKMVGGDIDRSTIDQWAGVQFCYGYSPTLAVHTNVSYGWVYPRDPNGSQFESAGGGFKTLLIPVDVNVVYNLLPESMVRPYLNWGAGLTIWDIRALDNEVSTFSRGTSVNGSTMNFTLIGGFGFEFFFTQEIVLNLGANYHRLLKGDEDTMGMGDDANNAIAELRFGLTYYPGAFRDRDQDGIEDKLDLDPLRKEDFDGFKDNDGAPEEDNDGDGIPDIDDKAPNKPEDMDGFKDYDGIPDADNDQDTIEDIKDKCPLMPEDFDDFEDHDGCPDTDNDNDGIPDSLDQCKNWPEDYNDYLDEDGCPDEKPQPEPMEKGKNIVLNGVTFPSGSAMLTTASFSALDEVFHTLVDFPQIEIEIQGHTDNTGNLHSNIKLSELRAHAVRQYLINRGIDPARIRAIGYGHLQPVADNATTIGRAANRRIEFVRIK